MSPLWNYRSRKDEKEIIIAESSTRFKKYFNVVNTDNHTNLRILKANLLYIYHQKVNVKKTKSPALKKILDVLNHVDNPNKPVTQEEINTLFNAHPDVRRHMMLFKDECPEALKNLIFDYEYQKCLRETGSDKKALLEGLNQANWQLDSLDEDKKNKLQEGRTGRFLAHFVTGVKPTSEQKTNSTQYTLGNALVSLQESLQSRITISSPAPIYTIVDSSNFVQKFQDTNSTFTSEEMQILLSDPEVNQFIDENWNDLSSNFKNACQGVNIDYKRMAGLAALAYYEYPKKSWSSMFSNSNAPRSLSLAKQEGLVMLTSYLQKESYGPDAAYADTDLIPALRDGKLGSIRQLYIGSMEQMAKKCPRFEACVNLYQTFMETVIRNSASSKR